MAKKKKSKKSGSSEKRRLDAHGLLAKARELLGEVRKTGSLVSLGRADALIGEVMKGQAARLTESASDDAVAPDDDGADAVQVVE